MEIRRNEDIKSKAILLKDTDLEMENSGIAFREALLLRYNTI